MTLTTESLRGWLANTNVLAFLYALEEGEIPRPYRHTPDAYRVLFGGTLLDDLSRHPNRKITAGGYTSTAAGRFQALYGTWGDFCKHLGETTETLPFTAEFQDLFGVWCLQRRGALGDIVAGKVESAVAKCGKEWASLPGSPYGQPMITMDQFLGAYTGAGGTIDNGELLTPTPEPVAPPEPDFPLPEKRMPLPLLAIATAITTWGPTIASLIPQVAALFDRDKQTPARLEAAQAVVTKIVETTGAVNTEAAMAAISNSPETLAKVREAVVTAPEILPYLVVEVGPGIEKTQAANLAAQTAERGFWRNPAFWFVMTAVVPPLYGVVGVLLWRMPEPSEQLVTQVVTGILGLAAVAGAYYLGSTQGSAQKTAIIAQQGASK